MRRRNSPPLGERIARGVGHLGFFVATIVVAFSELPKSMEFAADPFQLAIWAVFMCTGLIGGIAAWFGYYLIEYACIPFMTGATLIYFTAMARVVWTGENPGSSLAMCLTLVLASYLVSRFISLNALIHWPKRIRFRRKGGRFDE